MLPSRDCHGHCDYGMLEHLDAKEWENLQCCPPGIHAWKQGLYQDLSLVKYRTKEKNVATLVQWMNSLPS